MNVKLREDEREPACDKRKLEAVDYTEDRDPFVVKKLKDNNAQENVSNHQTQMVSMRAPISRPHELITASRS